MHAHFEPICTCGHGTVRVFRDGRQYGDEYDFVMTVLSAPGKEAYILGLKSDGSFTTAHRRAVFECLRNEGFRIVSWERKGRNPRTQVYVL